MRLLSNSKIRTCISQCYYLMFPYDSAGNPLLWNDSVLQWKRGRQLKQYGSVSFTYDAGGVRQSKTANGVTTSYFTEGNRIHKEERSDGKTLIYAYDESGIVSITYNGTLYYVQKNFQGDIVALVDRDGNVVAKYVYDAWGNTRVYTANGILDASSLSIGNINPFRYRGYYYDKETGLYYLQTRYYDPQIGRFLNADSVDYIAPDIIGGLNLYAYCNNNPVMYSDPDGHFFLLALIIGAIVGAVVGGTVAGVSAANNGAEGWELVGAVATGALVGGAIGAAVGAGVGLAATGAAVLSGAGSAAVTAGLSIVGGGVLVGAGALTAGALANVLFSVQRMGPGRHSNNQAENRYINYLQKKYNFSDKIREELHREISGRRLSNQEVEQILRDLLGLL